MEKPAHYGVDRAGIYLNVCGVGEILYLLSILLSSEYQGYEVCSAKIVPKATIATTALAVPRASTEIGGWPKTATRRMSISTSRTF